VEKGVIENVSVGFIGGDGRLSSRKKTPTNMEGEKKKRGSLLVSITQATARKPTSTIFYMNRPL